MKNAKMTFALLAASVTGGVFAADSAAFSYEAGEGVCYDEYPLVTASASISFDSRYMTYGVIDGMDPIVRPGAEITFFDWLYFATEAYFDVTKGNGKRFEYGNRAGKYTTLDSYVGLAHEFEISESVGSLCVDLSYMYEYMPRYSNTQYVMAELSLSGHWVEPTLYIERDLMRDEGTYASLELGHTFDINESFTVRPSVAQGIGNSLRTKGYFSELEKVEGFNHGGLMDTSIRLDFEYAINSYLTLGAYIAYYDYLFDDRMREAAAAYNGQWRRHLDRTWNFVTGISLTATF